MITSLQTQAFAALAASRHVERVHFMQSLLNEKTDDVARTILSYSWDISEQPEEPPAKRRRFEEPMPLPLELDIPSPDCKDDLPAVTLYRCGALCHEQQRLTEAGFYFNQALSTHPIPPETHAKTYNALGFLYTRQNDGLYAATHYFCAANVPGSPVKEQQVALLSIAALFTTGANRLPRNPVLARIFYERVPEGAPLPESAARLHSLLRLAL